MKITKQRLKEIIKEELLKEDDDISPGALLNDITALADLADQLRQKIQKAAFRNLEQHPQVREAISALEETKALLESEVKIKRSE
jgi:hypothetical protein